MTNSQTDQEIVQLLAKNAKKEAFELIVDAYTERIYWNLRKIVRIHEDADDLLQDVYVKVWQKIDQFRGDSSFYTWIYRISTNEALGFLRKKNKKKFVDLEEDAAKGLEEQLKADPYFVGNQAEIQLEKAIELLPEKQQLVFRLRYYDEMKYDEMSEILETSDGALRASYHIAVKKIEQELRKTLIL